MRKTCMKAMSLVLLVILPAFVWAQFTVNGTVKDIQNRPVPAASVKLKNSTTGTSTDASGNFSLSLPGQSAILEISSVGFVKQEITVSAANNTVTILLLEDAGKLEEVVVTGLATSVRRSNLANAVSSVSAKELVGTTSQPTLDGALYGKFPGANISANSGAPGGGISVKMRGVTSIVGNSQPLFIVDGVYYDNSSIPAGLNSVSKAAGQGSNSNQDNPSNRIADLDPEDIERVEILKGASAAAIYGSRAAGGVILITTKRGKSGKPKIEIGQSIGIQSQLHKLGQRSWDATKVEAAYGANGLNLYNDVGGKTYNYEDELYGNKGKMLDSRLSVSGGSERTNYYVGFSHRNDDGIVDGTGYRKTSFRVNLDQKVTKFLDLSVNTNYVSSRADRGYFNNDNTSTSMGVSFVSTPSWVNLYPDVNGNYPNNPLAPSNFLQTRDLITNREDVNRILLGGSITLKILSGEKHDLKIIARGGMDNYTLATTAIFPPDLQFQKDGNGTNGASIYGTTVAKNSNIAAFAVYTFTPKTGLSFRTQAGVTQEKLNLNNVLNTATQLIGTQTNLSQAGAIKVDQAKTLQTDRGFFVQEEINIKDIILATVGLRGDKSSRNGDPNKLYYYPKASLAFNIHELPSWNLPTISQLKARVAYGQSGNFAPFGAIYTPLVPAIFNGTTGSIVGLIRGNENLGPERQKELEMGLDLGLWRNRFGMTFTYYIKDVDDLLLNVDVASSSGYTSAWENVAAIQNKGVELGLNAIPIANNSWRWNTQLNFWKNNAEVTRLDVPAFNTGAFGATLGTYRIEKGKSPTQLVGIGTDADKVDPATGLAVFGNAEPDFNMSWQNGVTWKNFEFSVLMHWKQGGENINLSTLLSDIFGTSPDFDKQTLDPEKKLSNGNFRLNALGTTAGPWIEDATYFRVREIGLSYRMPKAWFHDIATVKIGFSGRNLINVFTYNSYDPEVSNFGSNAISSNVEVTPFPSAKSFLFNIMVTF